MKVSPLDIRKQTFRRTLQGFSRDDVIAYLGLIADELETVATENKTLADKAASLEYQLANYREIEASLRNAMVAAERSAEETRRQNAREEELRLRETELKIQKVLDEGTRRIRELKREIVELARERTTFLARFRLLLETQIKMLDRRESDGGEGDLERLALLEAELLKEIGREPTRTEVTLESLDEERPRIEPRTP
jgi:cell division initiation protein